MTAAHQSWLRLINEVVDTNTPVTLSLGVGYLWHLLISPRNESGSRGGC